MPPPRVDVVLNSTASRFRTGALVDQVLAACAGRARAHTTSSLAELTATCDAIARRGTDLVILGGGDGSFMAGVTALARSFGEDNLPRIAFLPGGTVATVARNWGTVGRPQRVLERLLAHPDAPARSRPTLRVRSMGDAGDVERVGFIFGTGLVARFFDVYYAEGARGLAGAARIVGRVFAESFVGGAYARRVLDPMPCTLEIDGERLPQTAWSLVCASVVRDLGLHMLVTHRAGEDPERPHLVASCLPPRALGPRAPRVLTGRPIGGPGAVDALVRETVVRFEQEGSWVLDGDVLRASEVRVTAGPLVRIVTPTT